MNPEDLKIHERTHWILYLHDRQGYLGRCYLVLKRKNEDDILSLTTEEQAEFFTLGRTLKKALAVAFKPDRLNFANLQNTWNQLHVHVIPRYSSPRTFAGHTFADPHFGHMYDTHHAPALPSLVLFAIKEEIKKHL